MLSSLSLDSAKLNHLTFLSIELFLLLLISHFIIKGIFLLTSFSFCLQDFLDLAFTLQVLDHLLENLSFVLPPTGYNGVEVNAERSPQGLPQHQAQDVYHEDHAHA